jgi:GT2 family glycosyltransferase
MRWASDSRTASASARAFGARHGRVRVAGSHNDRARPGTSCTFLAITHGEQNTPRIPPALSVVVFAYREQDTIVDAVQSLLEQASPEQFEVIVATSGGDRSATLVRSRFPHVEVIESPRRLLPGAARNAGMRAASGDIVAFLEGDCRAAPGWVSGRLAAHRRGHPAVACAMTSSGPSRPWAWAWHFDLYSGRLPGRPAGVVRYPDPAVHGLSLDRAALGRMGPFDEGLEVATDTDAARRLSELGIEMWFEPSVCTAHPGPRSTVAMLRDRYRRGAVAARAQAATAARDTPRGFVPMWWSRTRRSMVVGWRYGGGERWRLLASLPWLAASCAAGVAGRRRGRESVAEREGFVELDDNDPGGSKHDQ